MNFYICSVLCDETINVSTKEHMTIYIYIYICYVDTFNFTLKEDFIGFVEMASTTGTVIKNVLKIELEKIGLSFDYLKDITEN